MESSRCGQHAGIGVGFSISDDSVMDVNFWHRGSFHNTDREPNPIPEPKTLRHPNALAAQTPYLEAPTAVA